jgi:hypothetical protein
LALEIEVVEGGTELQKRKNRVGVGRNRTQQMTTVKVNFRRFRKKKKPAFDFN